VEDKCSGNASFALEVKSPRGGSASARVLYEGESRGTSRFAFGVRYVDNSWEVTATPTAGKKVTVELPQGWVGSAATAPTSIEVDWGAGSNRVTTVNLPLTATSRTQTHTYGSDVLAGSNVTVTVRIVSGSDSVDSRASDPVTILP
jgi:hypothetical protein